MYVTNALEPHWIRRMADDREPRLVSNPPIGSIDFPHSFFKRLQAVLKAAESALWKI